MSWLGFGKAASFTALVCVSAMIISRAPTLASEFNAVGIKFNINVGYVVIFSIPIIVMLQIWLWAIRDKSVLEKRPYSNNKWIISPLVFFPALATIFMFVQFVNEFSPPGECNTFSAIRYFWDMGLWELKPEYCFSLPENVQENMPYIYPPLQTWVYLSFIGASVLLSVKLRKYYHP